MFLFSSVPSLVRTGRYGEIRLSKAGRSRLEGYYVDQIWGVGANLVDELVLWSPLILSNERRLVEQEKACRKIAVSSSHHRLDVVQNNNKSGSEIDDTDDAPSSTPSSDRSTTSSTASNNTIVTTGNYTTTTHMGPMDTTPTTIIPLRCGPILKTIPVESTQDGKLCSNFIAPPALNIQHLLYLQEGLNKYIRRGKALL